MNKVEHIDHAIKTVMDTCHGLDQTLASLQALHTEPSNNQADREAFAARVYPVLADAQQSLAMMNGYLAFHLRQVANYAKGH